MSTAVVVVAFAILAGILFFWRMSRSPGFKSPSSPPPTEPPPQHFNCRCTTESNQVRSPVTARGAPTWLWQVIDKRLGPRSTPPGFPDVYTYYHARALMRDAALDAMGHIKPQRPTIDPAAAQAVAQRALNMGHAETIEDRVGALTRDILKLANPCAPRPSGDGVDHEEVLAPIPDGAIVYHDPNTQEAKWFMVRDANGYEDHIFRGRAYMIHAWHPDLEGATSFCWLPIAEICLKWDGCCHLGLAEPQLGDWAHVCGPANMEDVLQMLRWMWLQAQARISAYDQNEKLREKA